MSKKETTTQSDAVVETLNPQEIQPNDWNQDRTPNKELLDSIAISGVLQPIMVRPFNKGHQVVCGSRRLLAAQKLGLPSIPAVIRTLTDEQAREITVIENIQRQNLSAIEEAEAIRGLLEKHTAEEVAKSIGKGTAYVAQCRMIANLDPTTLSWIKKSFAADQVKRESLAIIAKIGKTNQKRFIAEYIRDSLIFLDPPSLLDAFLRYTMPLGDKCPFDQDKDNLVAGVIACSACPKRTAAEPELFTGIFSKKNVCGDPACYEAKLEAHRWAAVEAAAEKHQAKPCYEGWTNDQKLLDKLNKKGAVKIGHYGSDIVRCKKTDKGAQAFVIAHSSDQDAKIGQIVYARENKYERRESTGTGKKKENRVKGMEMVIRRRLALTASKIRDLVLKCKSPSKKFTPDKALVDLAIEYGVDGGRMERTWSLSATEKKEMKTFTRAQKIWIGVKHEAASRTCGVMTVSEIKPKEFEAELRLALSYISETPDADYKKLADEAVLAIKAPKVK